MSTKHNISLTGILVQDNRTKGFTAYVAEMPEVISQGVTEDEAKENLFTALKSILDFKREAAEEETLHEREHGQVTRFNLSVV